MPGEATATPPVGEEAAPDLIDAGVAPTAQAA
jgi:hypothetical protein